MRERARDSDRERHGQRERGGERGREIDRDREREIEREKGGGEILRQFRFWNFEQQRHNHFRAFHCITSLFTPWGSFNMI